MKYNGFNVPDKEVDALMEKMDISLADACELWLSDHDMVENETIEELSKKATKNRITSTIHSAKGEKKNKKPREKKENPLKREIMCAIWEGIYDLYEEDEENNDIIMRNNEKYIDLKVNGRNFTINLIEHRKKKE